MSFREGLLQARGQIAFIAALAISTGIIIYLENIDTSARIREQVMARLGTTGTADAPLSPELQPSLEAAAATGRAAYAADPSLALNRAAGLNAAALSVAHGFGSIGEQHRIIEAVLADLQGASRVEIQSLAPALALVSAAMPQYQPEISTLLSRN